MIPIRDDAPRTTTPSINYFLIGLNVLVVLFEASLTHRGHLSFDYTFGLVPVRVDEWLAGSRSLAEAVIPFFTSMFLHGGWLHLIFNMWALVIFGHNVEDPLGHFRYLLFYLTTGLTGGLTHDAVDAQPLVPAFGARGG